MKVEKNLRLVLTGASLAVVASALAACSGGGSSAVATSPPPPPPPPPAPQEDFFGTAFGADFRAAAISTPAVPKQGDIIPVSYTTEPQPITFP
jgi:hypothetical protein